MTAVVTEAVSVAVLERRLAELLTRVEGALEEGGVNRWWLVEQRKERDELIAQIEGWYRDNANDNADEEVQP